MLIRLPGGICFAHGRYAGMECSQSPACGTDPQKPEYLRLADEDELKSVREQITALTARATVLEEKLKPLPSCDNHLCHIEQVSGKTVHHLLCPERGPGWA